MPIGSTDGTGYRYPLNYGTVYGEKDQTAYIMGIHQGTIRLSIGLENIDDIIEDLESGFKALRESGLAK